MQAFTELSGPTLGTWNAFWGAGLGASFYILLRTQPHLRDRSGPAPGKSLTSGAGAALTPGVLAIVGGFAAEAVELVLRRLGRDSACRGSRGRQR